MQSRRFLAFGILPLLFFIIYFDSRNALALNFGELLRSHFVYIRQVLTADSELLAYGGATLFGLVMMMLALNIAAPARQRSTDAMLQLLKAEKEKAEHLANLKAEFLNQVSHELRTPLSVIIGYLECLNDGLYGFLDPKHQDILKTVAAQSTHLKNMIDQILIYSRLEASKQSVRVEEFNPVDILGDLRDTFEFLCRQKNLTLIWDIPQTSVTFKSDPCKFKDIASNLLQNAVKYTDTGSITVSITTSNSSDFIVLEVRDTGIGIPQSAQATIFEPFTQVHKTSTENSRGGIGLGLSIINKHVEQLRGLVTVESEIGKGSSFKVALPRSSKKTGSRFNPWPTLKLSWPFLATRNNVAIAPTRHQSNPTVH